MNKEEIIEEINSLRQLILCVSKAIAHDQSHDANFEDLEYPVRVCLNKVDCILERLG